MTYITLKEMKSTCNEYVKLFELDCSSSDIQYHKVSDTENSLNYGLVLVFRKWSHVVHVHT